MITIARVAYIPLSKSFNVTLQGDLTYDDLEAVNVTHFVDVVDVLPIYNERNNLTDLFVHADTEQEAQQIANDVIDSIRAFRLTALESED